MRVLNRDRSDIGWADGRCYKARGVMWYAIVSKSVGLIEAIIVFCFALFCRLANVRPDPYV